MWEDSLVRVWMAEESLICWVRIENRNDPNLLEVDMKLAG